MEKHQLHKEQECRSFMNTSDSFDTFLRCCVLVLAETPSKEHQFVIRDSRTWGTSRSEK